jgi:sn-1 stearoyl-lipid 9-desaturase
MATFLALFVIFYLWHGFGITIGYHRLLAHRSFRCNKFFEYFFVVGGYLAYQGPPIWWSAIHRGHHKYADTDLDPHTPRKGLRHALIGWAFDTKNYLHLGLGTMCKDLVKNRFYMMLEHGNSVVGGRPLCIIVNFAYRLLLLALFGWTVFWANVAASIGVFAIPQLLNVVCHLPKLGYKNFTTDNDGVNVWWVGLLGLGEGWHNNHHAYPGSSRSGVLPHEFDLSWQVIRLSKFFGWVIDANEPAAMMRLVVPGGTSISENEPVTAAKGQLAPPVVASSEREPVGAVSHPGAEKR